MDGRIAVLRKPKEKFIIERHDAPDVAPGTMLLRQELAGVCGTDVHVWEGFLPEVSFPVVLGHENVGKIAELGEGVKTDILGHDLTKGDRVFPVPGLPCWHCYSCIIDKEPTRCVKGESYGFFPYNAPYFTGGYADYLYLFHPNSLVFKVRLEAEEAVLIEPLAIAARTVERANIKIADTVVIQGSGPIGLLTLACVIKAGASRIVMVGAPERRLRLAEEFGADVTINITEVNDVNRRIEMVRKETPGGLGADVVIEDTGNPRAIPEGLRYLKENGRYMVIGCFTDRGTTELNPMRTITQKQTTIVGSWGDEPRDFLKAIRILEEKKFPFSKVVSHKIPLERISEGFQAVSSEEYMLDGREIYKLAIDLRNV